MDDSGGSPLDALFAPSSVVVVGASDDVGKTGGRAIHYLNHFGYSGDVFAVNRKRTTVQGHRAYRSPAELPVIPELAIIAVPGDAAVDAVQSCAELGVAAAIVTSSGFAETGDQGLALEQRLGDVARQHGIRVVGPNSQGIANFANRTVASFSSLFLTYEPADGPVAIISQSGSMSVVPYCQLRERGIGVRYSVATGNEVDVTTGEFAAHVLRDPEIELVLLYMESIKDAAPLVRAARIARERDVPVVALKAARSSSAQAAALSHTGALANEDRIVSAFFERHGIYRADDPDELVRASELYLKRYRPTGNRLAVITDSGATAVMLSDAAQRLDIAVEPLPAKLQRDLASMLPGYASTRNPIDMTSGLRAEPELFEQVLQQLAHHDVADLFIVGFPASGAGYDVAALARMATEFCDRTQRPLAVAVPQASIARHFRDRGLPTFQSETDAMRALKQLCEHTRLLRRTVPAARDFQSPPPPEGRSRLVPESEALEYFQACGLPVAPFRLCRNLDEAQAAYAELGPRVVLKGTAENVAHKAVLGLVSLAVSGPTALDREFERLSMLLEEMDARTAGIVVATECRFEWELALGAKWDNVFGPVLLLGEGGKHVEQGADLTIVMAPVERGDVLMALERLPAFHRWHDGQQPIADLDAFADLAAQLSDLVCGWQAKVSSLDLNPVAVGRRGEGVMILDALLERGTD